MSDSTLRLPERPSLEQLRKQAKELLKDYRAGDTAATAGMRALISRLGHAHPSTVPLADAQFTLARQYGFENWAALVHRIAATQMAESRLVQYEELAKDFVAAYRGDADALERVNTVYSRSFTLDQLQELFR